MIDLSDYEAYLEDDFDAIKFSNDILLSTNNPDDDNLDLITPIKRLTFDLNEIDRKIEKTSNENYTKLMQEFDNLKQFSNTINELKPSFNQLNLSYSRLENEILKPYNEASGLHSALKKIHQTSDLLRSMAYFIYLISKIEEIGKSEQELNVKPFKNLYQLSKLFKQLKIHLVDSPFLKSLKLVRDYENFQSMVISRIVDVVVKNFNSDTLASLDDHSILNLINSLIITSPETFFNQFQNLFGTSTDSAVKLIKKNLNNPKNLEKVFNEVSQNGKLLARLEQLMKTTKWIDSTAEPTLSAATATATATTVLDKLIPVLNLNSNIITLYWKEIALGIGSRFKEIVNRGGPIAKNLKNIKQELKTLVKTSVLKSFDENDQKHKGVNGGAVDGKECIEVTMMLNSISALDGGSGYKR